MRPPVSPAHPLDRAGRSRPLAVGVRAVAPLGLLILASGCGTLGSSQQLKQLQVENDRLISEYRAQRERVAALQETNAALEARVGEAERLLAQVGKTLPSSRISRAPQRGSTAGGATAGGAASAPGASSGSSSAPPYVPPSVPSLPENGTSKASQDDVQWRPMRRQ